MEDQYHHHHHHHHHHKYSSNPSFSSTLLDAIYRSIDFETQTNRIQGEIQDHQLVVYEETMRKCSGNINSSSGMKPKTTSVNFRDEEEMANYQRACLIEKWMEKKVVNRRNFNEYVDASSASYTSTGCTAFFNNSSSSSSDSSSGGGFFSSEAESVYGFPSSSSRTSCYGINKPRPIRTGASEKSQSHHKSRNHLQPKAAKHEESGKFVKTKSRALKIYGDLKKVKQPISPGGRLASFLNSIFTAGNSKKAKYDDEIIDSERKSKSANASTCSSASSCSRSCLSKKSSNTNASSGMKRSVRFYPVSVIVDEDSQPCGQKSLFDHDYDHGKTDKKNDNTNNIRASLKEELQIQALEKNRRVQEAARDLLRNFQKRIDQCEFDMIRNSATRISDQELIQNDNIIDDHDEDDEEDMDDDDASYASSDLFELDNLSAIGMDHQRYREELPVYETTHLGTNRAIANGLIL